MFWRLMREVTREVVGGWEEEEIKKLGWFGGAVFAHSSAKVSQKALCVMKLSLLEKRVPQSHLYSLVPQTFE